MTNDTTPLEILGHLVTSVKVYRDSVDPTSEGWAYVISGKDGDIESGSIDDLDDDDLDAAIQSVITDLDLPCTVSDWASEPYQDGGWAIWSPTVD